jgi:hypothetical protein
MNNWMNGVPYASWKKSLGLDTSNRFYAVESDITEPSQLFVFIDEDASTINDGMFVSIMNPAEDFEDMPAHRHQTGYTLGYADGHAGFIRFIEDEADFDNLRAAATIPK